MFVVWEAVYSLAFREGGCLLCAQWWGSVASVF